VSSKASGLPVTRYPYVPYPAVLHVGSAELPEILYNLRKRHRNNS